MFQPQRSAHFLEQSSQSDPSPQSAYLHIPFCRRRCYYCDFPVAIVGDHLRGETSGTIEQYVAILCQEIAVTQKTQPPALQTIFFGGGTPSLLSVVQLERILQTLDQTFGIDSQAEISLEMDPGTFDFQQVQGFKIAGVNRISLGVQAFQAELLQVCGRTHTVEDIYSAVDLLHQADVQNWSLDLISGLPHQSGQQWQESLNSAVKLNPTHLSIYDLIVEPVTAFGRRYQPGDRPLPSDQQAAEMYRTAQQILTGAGYDHYEISNYARSGYQCHHNRVYWENRPFYGFGMGAASYLQGQRYTRPRKTREYYAWVEMLKQGNNTWGEMEENTTDQLLDTLMLGLRLADGVNLSVLTQRFGAARVQTIEQCLEPYVHKGWVQFLPPADHALRLPLRGIVRLSDPEGFLFSNTVLADLFAAFDLN